MFYYLFLTISTTYSKKINFEFIIVNFFIFINNIIIIAIYINDILFVDFNKKIKKNIKYKWNEKFEITNFEFYIYYLEINIVKNRINRIL